MLKSSMSAGRAGVDNPPCFSPSTLTRFGDAKKSVSDLAAGLRG